MVADYDPEQNWPGLNPQLFTQKLSTQSSRTLEFVASSCFLALPFNRTVYHCAQAQQPRFIQDGVLVLAR